MVDVVPRAVTQEWTWYLPFMQQSVLLSAIRGCDGLPKRHKAKAVVKFYRRVVLLSAFDQRALTDPFEPGGGSFTGPIGTIHSDPGRARYKLNDEFSATYTTEYDARCGLLQKVADDFIDSRDELPYHYQTHMMHAFEIVGYKHHDGQVREYFDSLYNRMVGCLHLFPESEAAMDARLGDNEGGWRARNDVSTSCSD